MSSVSARSELPWIHRPGRELLRLAWPITISTLSFATMTLASTAFVAQIGADELAGVGLAGVVGFGTVCFGIGLLRGAKTLVWQAVGADRRDRVPELLGAAVGIALALGVAALAVGHLIAPLLSRVSASPTTGGCAACTSQATGARAACSVWDGTAVDGSFRNCCRRISSSPPVAQARTATSTR